MGELRKLEKPDKAIKATIEAKLKKFYDAAARYTEDVKAYGGKGSRATYPSDNAFIVAKGELLAVIADMQPTELITGEDLEKLRPGVMPDYQSFLNAMCFKMRLMNWGGKMFHTIVNRVSYQDRPASGNILNDMCDPSMRVSMTMQMWPYHPEPEAEAFRVEEPIRLIEDKSKRSETVFDAEIVD